MRAVLSSAGQRWLDCRHSTGKTSVPKVPWMSKTTMDQNNQARPVAKTNPPNRSMGLSAVMSTIFSITLPSK